MDRTSTIVGMDAHKAFIQVAILSPDSERPEEHRVNNTQAAIGKLAQKLSGRSTGRVRCCYEAGPTGYGLQRQLESVGIECEVIAPALIPKQRGKRVKTDRRDALELAKLHRAGLLTAVHPPTLEQEAVRDLCRARDDARQVRHRARQHLLKFLLRRSLSFSGNTWTLPHRRWLTGLRFEEAAAQQTFDHYMRAADTADEQLKSLDALIVEASKTTSFEAPVGILRCFHGIETLTATCFLSELGDVTRFDSPRKLASYLGVTPSEYSSGGKERRGGITRAGNAHLRRLLVEAAWHYRHCAHVGKRLRDRRKDQPQWAQSIADKAHKRLTRRFRHLTAQGKPGPKVNLAIVRELVGFLWAALHEQAKRAA